MHKHTLHAHMCKPTYLSGWVRSPPRLPNRTRTTRSRKRCCTRSWGRAACCGRTCPCCWASPGGPPCPLATRAGPSGCLWAQPRSFWLWGGPPAMKGPRKLSCPLLETCQSPGYSGIGQPVVHVSGIGRPFWGGGHFDVIFLLLRTCPVFTVGSCFSDCSERIGSLVGDMGRLWAGHWRPDTWSPWPPSRSGCTAELPGGGLASSGGERGDGLSLYSCQRIYERLHRAEELQMYLMASPLWGPTRMCPVRWVGWLSVAKSAKPCIGKGVGAFLGSQGAGWVALKILVVWCMAISPSTRHCAIQNPPQRF